MTTDFPEVLEIGGVEFHASGGMQERSGKCRDKPKVDPGRQVTVRECARQAT